MIENLSKMSEISSKKLKIPSKIFGDFEQMLDILRKMI